MSTGKVYFSGAVYTQSLVRQPTDYTESNQGTRSSTPLSPPDYSSNHPEPGKLMCTVERARVSLYTCIIQCQAPPTSPRSKAMADLSFSGNLQ